MNIVKYRYLYFAISLAVIIPGLIALLVWGFPLAIDFTGGSLLDITFSGQAPQPAQILAVYSQFGLGDSQVQSSGAQEVIIRSKDMIEDRKTQIVYAMQQKFTQTITVQSFETVGPSIG